MSDNLTTEFVILARALKLACGSEDIIDKFMNQAREQIEAEREEFEVKR